MDPLAILQLAMTYGGPIKAAIDEAISNDDLLTKITAIAKPMIPLLTDIGAKLFPKASTTLHTIGGVLAAFDPNTTKWLQGALNVAVTPSPNLVVDGMYGPLTRAAVESLQKQLGLVVDGLAGAVTQAALQAFLGKLPVLGGTGTPTAPSAAPTA